MSFRRALRRTLVGVSVLIALVLVAVGTGYGLLRASLPPLDGTKAVEGITARVTIERDAEGRVTVRSTSRADLAYGLGYAHGQDRFFQMDLLRRAGSGRLSALVGSMAVGMDRGAREHDLARTAEASFAASAPAMRARLEAYAEGVNAGRASLGARPWEYFVLRQRPEPWRAIDTMYVIQAMMRDLLPSRDRLELGREHLEATLDARVLEALLDPGNPWDAPIVGTAGVAPSIPVPPSGPALDPSAPHAVPATPAAEASARGSNSFAVAGTQTADGRALLANDMHLGLGLPVIWYATRLIVDGEIDAVGVTLPGTPALIAGSNGSIAWGFTVSYADLVDHVVIETDPDDATRYRTPEGWRPFDERVDVIEVARAAPESVHVKRTIWGPVLHEDRAGRPLATRWVPHLPEAVGLTLLGFLDVRSVDEALTLAPFCGMPHQNLVVAGADGRIAWTIIGRLPRRVGFDGSVPVSWADGTVGWKGWRTGDDVPRHDDLPLIWTANARVTTAEGQASLGDGDYALGARAGVIRDALRALDVYDEDALLGVQNVVASPLIARWRARLLEVVAASPDSIHRAVSPWLDDWTGGARASSVAYRAARGWRQEILRAVEDALLAPARVDAPWVRLPRPEPIVWKLLSDRPTWVPAPHASWDALERAAIDSLVAAWGDPSTWSGRTWGARNRTRIEHPLAGAFPPWIAKHLRLPPRAVDGDHWTARVASPDFGASERMVVAPGAEERGILHLPGGNAAHPLSPYRQGGYEAWVEGRRTPLLPGPAEHTLVLEHAR